MPASRTSSMWLMGLAAAALPACSLLVHPDESRLTPTGDASTVDGRGMADGTVDAIHDGVTSDGHPTDTPMSCATGCDDHVACTDDQCVSGVCTHTPNNAVCTTAGQICDLAMGCITPPECVHDSDCVDPNVCNGPVTCSGGHCVHGTPLSCTTSNVCRGTGTCDPATGCVVGPPPTCDDGNACTTDMCDAAAAGGAGGCVNTFVGGPGCVPPNDTCATAQVVDLHADMSASVVGTTVGAGDGVDSACGANGAGDVWYAVTYPSHDDLEISLTPVAGPMNDTVLVVRDTCTGGDLVCDDDISLASRASRIWVRANTAGPGTRTLYVIADAYQPGAESPFTIRFTRTTRAPSGMCGGPAFDVSNGGAAFGNVRAANSMLQGSCMPFGGFSTTEEVYSYASAGMAQVTLSASIAATGGPFTSQATLYVIENCGAGDVACQTGSPAQVRYDYPGGGSPAYIVVDGLRVGNDYTLRAVVP